MKRLLTSYVIFSVGRRQVGIGRLSECGQRGGVWKLGRYGVVVTTFAS